MIGSSVARFYGSTIGKKMVVAVTGVMMVGFVIAHMVGNLKVLGGINSLSGNYKIDEYAVFLRTFGEELLGNSGLLWIMRIGLLAAVILHVVTVGQLLKINQSAKPRGYKSHQGRTSTLAARSMYWGGVLILFFIIFHILHFTIGNLPLHGFEHGKVYANLHAAFSMPSLTAIYFVAMIALGFHLYHGTWSFVQTLGLDTPAWNGALRIVSKAIAVIVVLGFMAVPAAIFCGALPPPSASSPHAIAQTLH